MAKKPKKDEKTPVEDAPATPTENEAVAQDANTGSNLDPNQGPMLRILAQYTKDQSFENPNAPDSLRNGLEAPEISIDIEIGRQMFEDDTVEVVLILRSTAVRDGQTVFIAELEYGGLFAFGGVTADQIQPLILVECPRLLFPFARQIVAEMTQNGGYPPIMLEPPDFAAMFRDEMIRRQADMQETAGSA